MRQENTYKLEYERQLWEEGYELIAGLDEVGRGPLAGPVAAAAVVLPRDLHIEGVDDSKRLTAHQRNRLERVIKEQAVAWSVVMVFPPYLDQINILNATREAMMRAVSALTVTPGALIIDALSLPLAIPQLAIIKGDQKSQSVACASILAKEERDRVMVSLSRLYPGYGFEKHKGYATREHLEALFRLGPCPMHRSSFAPVRMSRGDQDGDSETLF